MSRVPWQAAAAGEPGGEGQWNVDRRLHRAADFAALEVARSIKLAGREEQIAGRVMHEIVERLQFLNAVGLNYISLDRSAATLSGGEGQRIRLATQIGSKLRGVLYVLDEPSIGLHHRDNGRLLTRSKICAISATPCSWSSTTKKPFAAPIT
jgi:ABC-type hemin transport system ATPase subunit